MGLVAPRHVGSSRTRDGTCVPCIGRRILNHCATREVPTQELLKHTDVTTPPQTDTISWRGGDRTGFVKLPGQTRRIPAVTPSKLQTVKKKDKILPPVMRWMDLEGIMLSEISQTERDKYRMISLICGIEKTTTTETHTQNK